MLNGETSHRWPYFLPDGQHFLYFAGVSTELASIHVAAGCAAANVSAQTTEIHSAVFPASFITRYLPPSGLAFPNPSPRL